MVGQQGWVTQGTAYKVGGGRLEAAGQAGKACNRRGYGVQGGKAVQWVALLLDEVGCSGWRKLTSGHACQLGVTQHRDTVTDVAAHASKASSRPPVPLPLFARPMPCFHTRFCVAHFVTTPLGPALCSTPLAQILLNKTDLASKEELEEVRERIQVGALWTLG